ncbi:MAG: hypothetical protein ABIO44_09775 [Saprospiraceae bacterium]
MKFLVVVSPTVNKVFNWKVLLLIYVFLFSTFLIFENIHIYYPYSRIIEGIIIFLACLSYFNDELRAPKVTRIVKEPAFWFVSAFLIYYGSSWLILLGSSFYNQDSNLFIYIWGGNNILNIIKNMLIVIGLISSK